MTKFSSLRCLAAFLLVYCALLEPASALDDGEHVLRVRQYLAVGWAEVPSVELEDAGGLRGALYLPAGGHWETGRQCSQEDFAALRRVGTRIRVRLRQRPGEGSGTAPRYDLHLELRENGTVTHWDLLACQRL